MIDVINKKIDTLSLELKNQVLTEQDRIDIEKDVEDYRQQLLDEKEEEYASNKIILEAQIEALKQVKAEIIDEQEKSATIEG